MNKFILPVLAAAAAFIVVGVTYVGYETYQQKPAKEQSFALEENFHKQFTGLFRRMALANGAQSDFISFGLAGPELNVNVTVHKVDGNRFRVMITEVRANNARTALDYRIEEGNVMILEDNLAGDTDAEYIRTVTRAIILRLEGVIDKLEKNSGGVV